MGKTALTINFALNSAANPDNHVTYLPAETGEESIIKRAIAILGELPVNAMRNPNKYLSEYDKVQFAKTVDKLGKLPLHIEELHDIREIRQLARETRKANPTKRLLFIIDHLGHLNCGGKQYASRTLEFEDYCMQLKAIAKEYKVAVMLLSQLSREVEKRPNKRPMNSDLRDSGSIEQIADLIAFLYRDNYYLKDGEKKPQDVIEFIISKNRDGGVGTRFFEFIPNTNKVVEL
jgi:replicative DNA helicase